MKKKKATVKYTQAQQSQIYETYIKCTSLSSKEVVQQLAKLDIAIAPSSIRSRAKRNNWNIYREIYKQKGMFHSFSDRHKWKQLPKEVLLQAEKAITRKPKKPLEPEVIVVKPIVVKEAEKSIYTMAYSDHPTADKDSMSGDTLLNSDVAVRKPALFSDSFWSGGVMKMCISNSLS